MIMGDLKGYRVIDMRSVMEGKWWGKIMEDIGEEVIKIERKRKGDEKREWGKKWMKEEKGKKKREE